VGEVGRGRAFARVAIRSCVIALVISLLSKERCLTTFNSRTPWIQLPVSWHLHFNLFSSVSHALPHIFFQLPQLKNKLNICQVSLQILLESLLGEHCAVPPT
jgi:hypothetical protein